MPKGWLRQFPTREAAGSRAGLKYAAANNHKMENEGEQDVKFTSREGVRAAMTFQIAKVTRPLMSVSKICDSGMTAEFDKTKAVVRDSQGKTVCIFQRGGGLYVCRMPLKPPKPFQGRGA